MGETIARNNAPEINIDVTGCDSIKVVEILRNSRVVKTFEVQPGNDRFSVSYTDSDYKKEPGVLYYYARITQENGHIAWSTPVWLA